MDFVSFLCKPDAGLPLHRCCRTATSTTHNKGFWERKRMHNKFARKDAMDDRLSSLPDDVIHKILSFINIKDAIGTSVLSTRWRLLWTSMPYLNFENHNRGPRISKFISKVLSHRNNQIQVSSLNLLFGRTVPDDESVTTILDCAFSHNVQQLSVTCAPGDSIGVSSYSFIATPTWDLPFLTTLHLHHVKLSDDDNESTLFSRCTNLKNLFLKKCRIKGTKVLNICHPRLSNLTLENTPPDMELELEEGVNVAAPQLKNLTIIRCKGKHLITAPGLTSLVIEGFHLWQLSTLTGFHSLDKVRLYLYEAENAEAHEIVCLLQQFHNVKLLTLNLAILQRLFSIKIPPRVMNVRRRTSKSAYLSSAMEISPHKACAFANAKILKFIPNIHVNVYLEVREQEKVNTFSEIKNYDTCPSAIFPMVSREEITAMGDMESADAFVKHLRDFVKHLRANTNSNTDKAHMDEHGKPQVGEMQWAWELQWNLGKMVALLQRRKIVQLEKCGMMEGLRRRYSWRLETHHNPMIAWLLEMSALFKRIEGLITQQLSASERGVLQPIFISSCQDAAILTNNMLAWMKTAKYRDTIALGI